MPHGKGTWVKAPKIKKLLSDDGALSDGFLTRDNTLTVTGKGQPGSNVVLFDKGEKIGVATVGGNGKWSIDTGQLGDGDHNFTATAKFGDRASKASKPVKGEVDTTAPGKPSRPDLVAASDTGSSSADNHTSDKTPTLTGIAEAGATMAIFDGASVLGTTIANGAGQWSFTTGALSDGIHAFTVTATDRAGNASAESAALSVTVDTMKPLTPSQPDLATASDTGVSSTDNLTNDRTPTLTGTAEAGATVVIKDGSAILGTMLANSAGQWSFTAAALADGAHSLTIVATDKAGNASPLSAALVVRIDTAGPVGAITLGPVTEDNIVNLREGDPYCAGDIPITGTVTGEIPDGATVTLSVNGVAYTGTVSGGAFSILVRPADVTDDADLTISASITVTDAAGNTDTITDTQTYTYNETRPAVDITGFSEDTGTSGDLKTSDNELTFFGTADPFVTIEISRSSGGGVVGQGVADEHGYWSVDTTVLPTGNWFFIATATNEVGNRSVDRIDVEIISA
jgi:hypothetical protein